MASIFSLFGEVLIDNTNANKSIDDTTKKAENSGSKVKIACRTNSVFEVNSLDGTEFAVNQVYELKDKFFLLSRPEIYGTYDSASYKDGTQLEYYEGLTNAEIIKRDGGGSARYAWLRSPTPSYAGNERSVYTDGSLYDARAVTANAVAPACIIA